MRLILPQDTEGGIDAREQVASRPVADRFDRMPGAHHGVHVPGHSGPDVSDHFLHGIPIGGSRKEGCGEGGCAVEVSPHGGRERGSDSTGPEDEQGTRECIVTRGCQSWPEAEQPPHVRCGVVRAQSVRDHQRQTRSLPVVATRSPDESIRCPSGLVRTRRGPACDGHACWLPGPHEAHCAGGQLDATLIEADLIADGQPAIEEVGLV